MVRSPETSLDARPRSLLHQHREGIMEFAKMHGVDQQELYDLLSRFAWKAKDHTSGFRLVRPQDDSTDPQKQQEFGLNLIKSGYPYYPGPAYSSEARQAFIKASELASNQGNKDMSIACLWLSNNVDVLQKIHIDNWSW